eukprot:SAG31_NODE_56_length_29726_cov_41.443312_22_plen_380_part_00
MQPRVPIAIAAMRTAPRYGPDCHRTLSTLAVRRFQLHQACRDLEKRLYRSFCASCFGTKDVSDASALLDEATGVASWGWEAFAMPWVGQIDGLHDAALVRRRSRAGYEDNNVVLATRLHFFCIELARRERGLYERDLKEAVVIGRLSFAATALDAATAARDFPKVQQIAHTLLSAGHDPPTRQQMLETRVGRALGRAVRHVRATGAATEAPSAQILLRQWRSAMLLSEHPDTAVKAATAELFACCRHTTYNCADSVATIERQLTDTNFSSESLVAGIFGEEAAAMGAGRTNGASKMDAQQLKLDAVLRKLGVESPPCQMGDKSTPATRSDALRLCQSCRFGRVEHDLGWCLQCDVSARAGSRVHAGEFRLQNVEDYGRI